MLDMNQIQVWFEMMKDLKNQQGRGVSSLDAQQGEPHGSAEYQWQLGQAARDQTEEERQIRMALMSAQGQLARAQANDAQGKADISGVMTTPQGHWQSLDSKYYPYMPGGGGGGGGKGGGVAGPPELTQAQEGAQRARALAETDMYERIVRNAGQPSYYQKPYDSGFTGYEPKGSQYDPSTSSYGPSGGGTDSWIDVFDPSNQGGVDMTGW